MKKKRNAGIQHLFIAAAVFFCACAPAESINVQESYRTGEIPEVYEAQRGKVTFRMDVTIPEAALDFSFTEAKATALKAEEEAACSTFLEGRKVETIQEGKAVNESGKKVHFAYYNGEDGLFLGVGPWSSCVSYRKGDGADILSELFLETKYDDYNGDRFLNGKQLSFASQEETQQSLIALLDQLGICPEEYSCSVYTLDSESVGQGQWTGEDDSYYLALQQFYKGVPLYHAYFKVFDRYEDANAPVQAGWNAQGISSLDTELLFEISQEEELAGVVSFERVIAAAAKKYNRLLGDWSYTFTDASFYYMVDVTDGRKAFRVFPAWILSGYGKADGEETEIRIVVDAATGKEVV